LLFFAMYASSIEGPLGTGALNGLKIVAVPIIAQAVLGMSRTLCPDKERAAIAVAAVAILAFLPGPFAMVAAILFGAAAGLVLGRGRALGGRASGHGALPVGRRSAAMALVAFFALLVLLPLVAGQSQPLALTDSVYRA